MSIINHVDNDLFAPTPGHEVARIWGVLSQRVGDAENLTLTDIGE